MPQIDSLPPALESILADLDSCVERQLYYPALLVALTIPEICITLAFDKNVMVKEKHYAAFIERYTDSTRLGMTGVECYQLRCGIVHRADFAGHPKSGSTHVIFTLPNTQTVINGITMEAGTKTAKMFDLSSFCDAIVAAAKAWFVDNALHPLVLNNLYQPWMRLTLPGIPNLPEL